MRQLELRTTATAVCALILGFAAADAQTQSELRLTPPEIAAKATAAAGTGTSGVASIRTTVLFGDPTKAGIYTLRLTVPPNTKIGAHTHRDERTAIVIAGTWYFGYGRVADEAVAKALPAGSFYTEPAGTAHFAMTKTDPVEIYITGYGPSDTSYIDTASDPRAQ